MVFNNLAVVSLSPGWINPTLRDALIYSNCVWPYAMERFIEKLKESESHIRGLEEELSKTYGRLSQVLDLPVYRCDKKAITLMDELFSTVDSSYKVFGSSLPKVSLKAYSGVVCAHLTTHEWEVMCETLLNKFPDLRPIWNREIHSVSFKVLEILDCIEIYYRRACFIYENSKMELDVPFDSWIQMKAMDMDHPQISNRYRSHMAERAPFLDSVDGYSSGVPDGDAGRTTAFESID